MAACAKVRCPRSFSTSSKIDGVECKSGRTGEREEETAGDHRERRRWAPRSNKSKETEKDRSCIVECALVT